MTRKQREDAVYPRSEDVTLNEAKGGMKSLTGLLYNTREMLPRESPTNWDKLRLQHDTILSLVLQRMYFSIRTH